jgi:hypothetical protein
MGLPSRFLEKNFVKHEKGDDITPFDGSADSNFLLPFNSLILHFCPQGSESILLELPPPGGPHGAGCSQ